MAGWIARVSFTEPDGDTFPEEFEFTDRREMFGKIGELLNTSLESDEIEIYIGPKGDES